MGGVFFTPSCRLTNSWLSDIGDRDGFPSLTLKVSPTVGGQLGLPDRQRLLGVAHARAMGLELGLRYTAGPVGAVGGVGSSSMKAE